MTNTTKSGILFFIKQVGGISHMENPMSRDANYVLERWVLEQTAAWLRAAKQGVLHKEFDIDLRIREIGTPFPSTIVVTAWSGDPEEKPSLFLQLTADFSQPVVKYHLYRPKFAGGKKSMDFSWDEAHKLDAEIKKMFPLRAVAFAGDSIFPVQQLGAQASDLVAS